MVSPQYHVVFDDKFTTVKYLQSSEEPPNLQDLFTHHTERSTDKQQKLAEEWLQPHIVEASSESNAPLEPEVIDEVMDESTAPVIQAPEGDPLHIS